VTSFSTFCREGFAPPGKPFALYVLCARSQPRLSNSSACHKLHRRLLTAIRHQFPSTPLAQSDPNQVHFRLLEVFLAVLPLDPPAAGVPAHGPARQLGQL